MIKYTIEVTSEGIVKTITDGKETFTEKWIIDEKGMSTVDDCLTAKLDQYGDFKEKELLDALDNDDIYGLYECLYMIQKEVEH